MMQVTGCSKNQHFGFEGGHWMGDVFFQHRNQHQLETTGHLPNEGTPHSSAGWCCGLTGPLSKILHILVDEKWM